MRIPSSFYIGLLVSLVVGSVSSQNVLNGPQGVVYDSVSHRMLLTNFTDGAIVQVDSNHQQSYFQTGLQRSRNTGRHYDAG